MSESASPRLRLPLPPWARDYQRGWARPDVVAAVTVWAVLIPESLAYATIAGVSPVVGLYAAVPAIIIYALLGTSRHLVVAPMSATAALSASIAATYAGGDAADYLRVTITLTLVAGVLGLLAGLLRLGFLSAFISEPVLKGFVIGLALMILIGQVPALLGVEKGGDGFLAQVAHLVGQVGDIQPATAAVGLGALVLILALRRWVPGVPSSLVVVALGVVASVVLDLAAHGVEVVGAIESGLPSLGLPDSSWSQYTELLGPGAGVLLVGFVEGLAAAKSYALREGVRLEVNRDLGALGVANLGSGLAGGMVVNGSLSKTAVHASAGGRTQVANLLAGLLTVVTLLLLTGLFEDLPETVLAAVVISAVIDLVDLSPLRHLYGVWSAPLERIYHRAARADFIAATGAFVGVLVLDVLPGLLLGVGLSLILLLHRASRPHVARLVRLPGTGGSWIDTERRPDLSPETDVAVLRVEGAIFFANADHVRDLLVAAAEHAGALVLDAQTIASVDVSAAAMLGQLVAELEERGIPFLVAGGLGQVHDVVNTSGHRASLARWSPDVDSAVAAARELVASRDRSTGAPS